ncbi:MAG: beta-galactosidase, partial [Anaerolineae bacterium]|nr:beta-galactosidase [Caldilineales bacterium]MDW8268761.1 beta-galactosidase [Anaerolineae bacterium]
MPYKRILLALSTIVGLALMAIVPGMHAGSEHTSASTAVATPADPFGVYFFFAGSQPVGAAPMAAAGAKWAHLHIHWRQVESQPGVYNWSSLDTRLGNLAAHGFQIVLTVNGNPDWAATTVCGPIHSQHLGTFANFLSAAVARYSVPPYNVRHWALYNEPDNANPSYSWLGGCWGKGHANSVPGAGGAAYATMLKRVYPAMKAANPQVQVWIGGLAHEWFTTKGGIFDANFLKDVLAAGG